MQIELLNQNKTIAQLVGEDIDTQIMEFIKTELSSDEYNFIVTSENLKFAKDKMAELNKSIKAIDTFRKDKVSKESIAIDAFKVNVKEYVSLIDAKREELKKAVDVFETETKAAITKELSLYADELLKKNEIRQVFNNVDIVDLIVLGSVTPRGVLTKKARESVEGRVMACKSKQDKYDMRLMQLENLSYKAGLESPLTLTHVQGIIYLESDAEYSDGIEKLLESELGRQDTMKKNIEDKIQEDALEKAKIELQKEQNHIRGIFNGAWGTANMSLDEVREKISEFENYNFAIFEGNESFARFTSNEQIEYLKKIEYSIVKSDEAKEVLNRGVTSEIEARKEMVGVPVVEETVPFTPDEKKEQREDVEAGKKIVYIDVHLQFKVKDTIADQRIIDKVNQMLADAGFNESLIGVEVVS